MLVTDWLLQQVSQLQVGLSGDSSDGLSTNNPQSQRRLSEVLVALQKQQAKTHFQHKPRAPAALGLALTQAHRLVKLQEAAMFQLVRLQAARPGLSSL